MIVTKSIVKIGPQHHGREMSLRAFEFAKTEDGYLYELARGYIVVAEVANYFHGMQIDLILDYLRTFKTSNRGLIHAILENMACKLLIPEWDSERHPDIAVYLTAPKGKKDRTVWRTWIPELTIEIVSEGSRDRDYTEKRDEYWTLGVKEYWIVDAKLEQVLFLKRGRSKWIERTLGPADDCETRLQPGFKLSCREFFETAREKDA